MREFSLCRPWTKVLGQRMAAIGLATVLLLWRVVASVGQPVSHPTAQTSEALKATEATGPGGMQLFLNAVLMILQQEVLERKQAEECFHALVESTAHAFSNLEAMAIRLEIE